MVGRSMVGSGLLDAVGIGWCRVWGGEVPQVGGKGADLITYPHTPIKIPKIPKKPPVPQ